MNECPSNTRKAFGGWVSGLEINLARIAEARGRVCWRRPETGSPEGTLGFTRSHRRIPWESPKRQSWNRHPRTDGLRMIIKADFDRETREK